MHLQAFVDSPLIFCSIRDSVSHSKTKKNSRYLSNQCSSISTIVQYTQIRWSFIIKYNRFVAFSSKDGYASYPNTLCVGSKKTVCLDENHFNQNKLFFIFTLIIFSEHSYFLRKSQITPERKQRKKRFFNSICTPPEHPDSPQNLYLWAFSQFSPVPSHTHFAFF